jgi:hypothetical protein
MRNQDKLVDRVFRPRFAITKHDIEKASKQGKKTIVLEPNSVITDEARERAQILGVKITNRLSEIQDLASSASKLNIASTNSNSPLEIPTGKPSLKQIADAVAEALEKRSFPPTENLVRRITKRVIERLWIP